jgi:hypothetical protein
MPSVPYVASNISEWDIYPVSFSREIALLNMCQELYTPSMTRDSHVLRITSWIIPA